ncbi:hypothetical protein [Streptomyces sp. SudanB182_2057]|uniref:hypothetical protein n=1 Tax=Streptomyces sp. SudanB182_2057 TaxID=3035281 RepID=UPI003F549979
MDDGRVRHADQLCETLVQACGGQFQDDGELVTTEAADGGVPACPRVSRKRVAAICLCSATAWTAQPVNGTAAVASKRVRWPIRP